MCVVCVCGVYVGVCMCGVCGVCVVCVVCVLVCACVVCVWCVCDVDGELSVSLTATY